MVNAGLLSLANGRTLNGLGDRKFKECLCGNNSSWAYLSPAKDAIAWTPSQPQKPEAYTAHVPTNWLPTRILKEASDINNLPTSCNSEFALSKHGKLRCSQNFAVFEPTNTQRETSWTPKVYDKSPEGHYFTYCWGPGCSEADLWLGYSPKPITVLQYCGCNCIIPLKGSYT